jgi:outer membrane lipopolysaccharide assembly protein LptE/RlpB
MLRKLAAVAAALVTLTLAGCGYNTLQSRVDCYYDQI